VADGGALRGRGVVSGEDLQGVSFDLARVRACEPWLLAWPLMSRDDKNRMALITPEQLIEFRTAEVMGKILSGEKFDLGVPRFPV
jgi:hypothetical protein